MKAYNILMKSIENEICHHIYIIIREATANGILHIAVRKWRGSNGEEK